MPQQRGSVTDERSWIYGGTKKSTVISERKVVIEGENSKTRGDTLSIFIAGDILQRVKARMKNVRKGFLLFV